MNPNSIAALPSADPITVEVMALRPQVRDDLRISRHVDNGVVSFLIEDPSSGRFSRIGVAEYTFVSLLDGRTTVAEALAMTAAKHGLAALDEQDAVSLCGWIVEAGLAHTPMSRSGSRLSASNERASEQKLAAAANPMFIKLPLGNPSFVVAPLTNLARRFLANRVSLIGIAIGLIATALAAIGNYDRFWAATRDVLASENWMWLAATWLIVKGVHELGHAVACRWLGGRVGQAGVTLVLFMPMPYVDVSSSSAFPNKWHRMLVAAAGMIVEAGLAAIAFWVWMLSDDPVVQMHARNLIVTATITTVLFNLNPLMRFDGYYLLSDFLELPNLSTNAARWLTYVRQRYWFGATITKPEWPEGRAALVAAYAVAAMGWRVLICVSLAIGASQLFWGAGIVMTFIAIAFWIGKPLMSFLSNWIDPMRINRRHFSLVTAGMVAVIVSVMLIPYQRRVLAPVVVAMESPAEVRSHVRGFVADVLVEPGDVVEAGDVLARLENRELEIDLQRLSTEIEQSIQRQRVLRRDESLVELEIERAAEVALTTRQHDLQSRFDALVVKSSVSGTVIESDLIDKLGTLVTEGQRLLVIADPSKLKLVAMIGQDDVVTLRRRDQFTADVWIEGQGKVIDAVCFDRLQPRATGDLVHPALASSHGGPLAVYANPQAREASEKWKLVQPRVVAETAVVAETLPVVTNSADEGAQSNQLPLPHLRSGQRGTVRFALGRRSVGAILMDELLQWYRQNGVNSMIASR